MTVFVDGSWRQGEREVTVVDPADPTRVVGSYETAAASTVGEACTSAERAFGGWSRRAPEERVQILRRIAGLLDDRTETLARLVVGEEGKTFAEARAEVRRSAEVFRYYGGEVLQPVGSVVPVGGSFTFTRRRPRGVVAVVTAFNYPLLVPAWKLAAALAFGNTVVWKPARGATLAAIELCRIFEEAELPDGVVQMLPGSGPELGPRVVADPRVVAVTFTGSTGVGRSLEEVVAGRGTALQLEMGGKNAAVVLADADLEHAARRIAYGTLSGSGQKCTAIERCIVEAKVADELVAALVDEFGRWRVGPGMDPETRMGPVVDRRAWDRIVTSIDAATEQGAVLVTGGVSPLVEERGGWFIEPTLLDGVEPSDPIAIDEVFGPVLAVLRVADVAEAVRVHEATRYGLNAGIFTRDVDRAFDLVDRLTVGMVHVNDVSGFPLQAPFGGRKDSGHGPLELGKAAVSFFTEEQVVHVHHRPS